MVVIKHTLKNAMLPVITIINVLLAIAIPIIPLTVRIVRSSALSIKENMYVESARAM